MDNEDDNEYTYEDVHELKGISMGSLNVRSLFKNLNKVLLLLEKTDLSILALQETFLNQYVGSLILESPDHNIWCSDRTLESGKSCGGGLCMYTNKKYDVG